MKSELFTGRYLFHLHTTYTDGKLTFSDYIKWGRAHDIDRLIYLEHIRSNPNYDVRRFINELKESATPTGLPVHLGFEAKILPGGRMDISDVHAAQAEVIGMAEHSFQGDFDLWRISIETALAYYSKWQDEKHMVWAHPGLWLKKRHMLEEQEGIYIMLLERAVELGWHIERNFRYDLLPQNVAHKIDTGMIVEGADAHQTVDLDRWLLNSSNNRKVF